MISSRNRAMIHERLHDVLGTLVAEDLRKNFRRKPAPPVPSDLAAQHVAATFVLVLNWWVNSETPLHPEKADDLFRALILPTLSPTFSREPPR